jgi:hypothetical protein
MAGTDAGSYAVIETFTPQEFRYYPQYYITSAFFAVFFMGLIFVVWVPLVMTYCTEGLLNWPAIRAAVSLTATFLLLVALGRLAKREFGRTRFIVSHEGIVRRDLYRTVSIAWRDIVSVRRRRRPGAKGALEITAPYARLLLPSTITEFGRFCGAVRNGLERAAMGTVSERWNERAKAAFWPLAAAAVGTLLFNAFVVSRVWEMGPAALIVWAGTGLPMPLVVYSVADIRFNRRLEKALLAGNNSAAEDDFAAEIVVGFLVVAPLYGILGIIAKTIFLW